MMSGSFSSPSDSHQHSLFVLNTLYEYDDFMESVGSVMDLGAGPLGLDIEWWATRTTREDNPRPLNIRCLAVDKVEKCLSAEKHKNITYQRCDFEQLPVSKNKFDLLWCHDSFQYVVDPISTLGSWWHATHDNGMLCLVVPQFTNFQNNEQAFDQPDLCYHNHTMVGLIHMLAVSGWDCASGHFYKRPDSPWLYAIVYKSKHQPMDPRSTRWYDLAEKGLLPESAVKSIDRWGYLRQKDLVLMWIDKTITWLGKH